MVNALLFTIVFLWLFALTVRQVNINHWIKTLQDERFKMLTFIKESKATWTKNRQQEKDQ